MLGRPEGDTNLPCQLNLQMARMHDRRHDLTCAARGSRTSVRRISAMEEVSRLDQLEEELRLEKLKVKKAKDKIKSNRLTQIALTPAKSESDSETSNSSISEIKPSSRLGGAAPLKKNTSTNAYKAVLQRTNPKILPLMEAVGPPSQYRIFQVCLTLLRNTLLLTIHPPHVHCSSADPALFCLC